MSGHVPEHADKLAALARKQNRQFLSTHRGRCQRGNTMVLSSRCDPCPPTRTGWRTFPADLQTEKGIYSGSVVRCRNHQSALSEAEIPGKERVDAVDPIVDLVVLTNNVDGMR